MDLIIPGSGLIVWQIIGFSILLFILAKFAWKPILSALDEREKSIEDALKSAEIARNEMANLKAENEKIIHEAKLERDEMLLKATETAKQIVENAREAAQVEGAKMIEAAKKAIDTEKQAAMEEVKVQVAALSLSIAEKVLRKNLADDTKQKALVEELIKDLKLN
ncbi:F0F1 ATP synthase subunit B [Arthrospiribacter ruber]|uniref:ATP synthase subunit b n=1 Tax=Arthrospiribacter ruber TaxID=2487934 RepID=A0A951MCQ2_9BACT|nr:F0F1 ATP synthase subunit B [Arthrospiribacter ruber]MBW3467757.1 F0F1 ATP synthase subunit B [Arthrospiribacter ruber]